MRYSQAANTNLQAVFDDLLTHAKMWKVSQDMYPSKIYIFTDGQFDAMTDHSDKTHLQVIEQKHTLAGYKVPQIVFWNLRGDIIDFPSPGNKQGVVMLSGFSPTLLKLVLSGNDDLNPVKIMKNALDDEALDRVKLA